MNGKPLSKDAIELAVGKTPAVCDELKKLASKVARGVKLPETFSAKGLDYDAQRELEHLFGTVGQRAADGRFHLPIHSFLRDPAMWRDALEYFGFVKGKDASCDDEDVFSRLKLLEPDLLPLINKLAANEEVTSFLAKPGNKKEWKRLFRSFVKRFSSPDCGQVTTLSQLGSDLFNDSKKLRSGALRRQLVIICATIADVPTDDERRALEGALIVDNPYTSSVVFSAPLQLIMKNGEVLDYPCRYFVNRMATQLPLETELEIEEVKWAGKTRCVTTSENAAPFETLVREKVPCLYTEGYPNSAVIRLLELFAEQGVTVDHAGDGDLDGFVIAERISKAITVRRVIADELAADEALPRRPVSPQAYSRWDAYLAAHPDFAHASSLRIAMERGWIEQESMDMNVQAGRSEDR